jgi:hypothetical protein
MWSFYFSHVRSTFPCWDTPKFSLVSDLGGCRQLDTCRQLDALLYISGNHADWDEFFERGLNLEWGLCFVMHIIPPISRLSRFIIVCSLLSTQTHIDRSLLTYQSIRFWRILLFCLNHILNHSMFFAYQSEMIFWLSKSFSSLSNSIQHDFQVISCISHNFTFYFAIDGIQWIYLFLLPHKLIKQNVFQNSEQSTHQTWLRQLHCWNHSQ